MNVRHRVYSALFALLASSTLLCARPAAAELTLYDKDGWTLKHDGLAQGFYMLSFGDKAPDDLEANPVVDFFGFSTPPADDEGNFVSSRFRSGWTGGRFNWIASKQMSPDTRASAVLGVAYSISTHNAPTRTNNGWDVRNGYVQIEGPWGDVTIGRSVGLYTLGGIISTMTATSAPLGLGNTCGTEGDGLSCYTSAYGVKFPGFWAGMYYQTPSLGGLKIKVAALDPERAGADIEGPGDVPVSQLWARTPLPMFQTLIRYEGDFGAVKVNPYFNGFWQQVGRAGTSDTLNPMGGGVGVDVLLGIVKLGVGGTLEHGSSLGGPLYGADPIDGAGELRDGAAIYGHALVTLGPVDLSAGYGQASLERSDFDEANDININDVQRNIHGAVQYRIEPLTFVGEVNLLKHTWYAGNEMDVTVISLGANFAY